MGRYLFLVDSYYPKPSSNGVCVKAVVSQLIAEGNEVSILELGKTKEKRHINNVNLYSCSQGLIRNFKEKAENTNNRLFRKTLWFLYLLFNRLSKLLFLPWYPLSSPFVVYRLRRAIYNIIKEQSVNTIIVCYKPIDLIASVLLCDKKHLSGVKQVAYILDSFYHSGGTKALPQQVIKSRGQKWETKTLRHFDRVIYMDSYRDNLILPSYDAYRRVICYSDFPLLSIPQDNPVIMDNNRFVYAGTLSLQYRNPTYACEFFSELKKQNASVIFEIYSRGDCDSVVERYYSSEAVVRKDFLPYEEIKKVQKDAFALISIGNTDLPMVPAKIFEMMSMEKPIIHFYKNKNDSCLPYLEKYPMACLIDENKDIKESIIVFQEFKKSILGIKEQELDGLKDKLKNLFLHNTPEYTTRVLNYD